MTSFMKWESWAGVKAGGICIFTLNFSFSHLCRPHFKFKPDPVFVCLTSTLFSQSSVIP